jgi:hypothetical protein
MLGIGITALFSTMVLLMGADQGPTLGELAKRIELIESRLSALDGRVKALEGRKPPEVLAPSSAVIEIVSPKDRSDVHGNNVDVEGLVRVQDLGDQYPVLLVKPQRQKLYWVQEAPSQCDQVADGFRFLSRVFIGTINEGVGERFEIFALLAKRGTYKEGASLVALPKGLPISPTVVVKRVD